jgi:hypothetical protein
VNLSLDARVTDQQVGSRIKRRVVVAAIVEIDLRPTICQAHEQVLAAIRIPGDDAREDTQASAPGDDKVRPVGLGIEIAGELWFGLCAEVEIDTDSCCLAATALTDDQVSQLVSVSIHKGRDGVSRHDNILRVVRLHEHFITEIHGK